MWNRPAATMLALLLSTATVFGIRSAFYIAPAVAVTVLSGIAAVAFAPRFRGIAGSAGVFAVSGVLFASGVQGVSYAFASWWPTEYLGWASIIWLPILLVALVPELLLPVALTGEIRPSTAVAAAGFMIVPTLGTDVITPYHDDMPSIVAGVLVAILPHMRPWSSRTTMSLVYRVLEPFCLIAVVWLVVFLRHRGLVEAGELKWWLPLIAAPASIAALIGGVKQRHATGGHLHVDAAA